MAEVFLCPECDDVVDVRPKTKKEYVVRNCDTARSRDQWLYVHVRCEKAARRAAKKRTPLDGLDAATGKRLLQAMFGQAATPTDHKKNLKPAKGSNP